MNHSANNIEHRKDKNDGANPLPSVSGRVLLFNPPVYDTRLHWAKWHQPTLLLRLAAYYHQAGADVRLLDAMSQHPGSRLHRERIASLAIDGKTVYKWRYGLAQSALHKQLREFTDLGWYPDQVYVECFTTFWWEGAAEAIRLVRINFPQACVVLIGSYPALAPDHARTHTEDILEEQNGPVLRAAEDTVQAGQRQAVQTKEAVVLRLRGVGVVGVLREDRHSPATALTRHIGEGRDQLLGREPVVPLDLVLDADVKRRYRLSGGRFDDRRS